LVFPGKSQEEATFSVNDTHSKKREEQLTQTDITIDSINPFTWINAGAIAAKFEPDVILFKYWMPFFAPAYGTLARVAKWPAKKRGHRIPKIVFIADNVVPHEMRPGDLQLTHYAFRAVDSFIVHSDAVERELLQVDPKAQYVKLPHGIFEIFGEAIPLIEARK